MTCTKIRHLPTLTANDVSRFHATVARGHADGCWPWSGSIDHYGYGRFSVGGKWYRASRIAMLIQMGSDPGSLCVCHSCDNPCCCNPRHLFLGTQHDNVRDCCDKGRHKYGLSAATLTSQQVIAIKGSTLSIGELAQRYGVAQNTISAIQMGRLWPQVAPDLTRESRYSVITDSQVRLIRRSLLSNKDIAKTLGISPSAVSGIRGGQRRADIQ
jgi:hypothetical protein